MEGSLVAVSARGKSAEPPLNVRVDRHLDIKGRSARLNFGRPTGDANLVTSRKPDDIPAFNREIINLFSQSARH